VYGVMTHLVAERTREIGIRIALGAVPREILGLLGRQGTGIAATGIALGIIGSLAATRLLAGMLYQVRPTDPPTFAGTAVVIALVAAGATLIPAIRATRVDPAEALRSE
jgi:putative ABC transport system permease protein